MKTEFEIPAISFWKLSEWKLHLHIICTKANYLRRSAILVVQFIFVFSGLT